MIKAQTLKGFRDFLPKEARKRQFVLNTLKKMFELYGFEPLETPTLEYEEVLTGKYGEEGDKLMYKFTDRGERKVAMRYDQTVPLARVVAQYKNELPMPFKRYQIQNVWRAENPQKGRFREFLQVDADIVGSISTPSDTETIAVAVKSLEKLGFKNYKVLINDRDILQPKYIKTSFNIPMETVPFVFRALDKIKKINEEGVLNELTRRGFTKQQGLEILEKIKKIEQNERLNKIFNSLEKFGIDKSKIKFSPMLARGLDYYTGMIFEIEVEGYTAGSIAGGGRYDNLIGIFSNGQIPAVGFSFGFDRLIEAMEQLKLFPDDLQTTKVLVTIFNGDLLGSSIKIANELRQKGINVDFYDDPTAKMEKQLKYANAKGIPFVLIIGPNEAEKNVFTIKNMKTREQETLNIEELIKKLK